MNGSNPMLCKQIYKVCMQEVMLRRLKRDVMAELPPKRRQVVRLPCPKPADWPDQAPAEGNHPEPKLCLTTLVLLMVY